MDIVLIFLVGVVFPKDGLDFRHGDPRPLPVHQKGGSMLSGAVFADAVAVMAQNPAINIDLM